MLFTISSVAVAVPTVAAAAYAVNAAVYAVNTAAYVVNAAGSLRGVAASFLKSLCLTQILVTAIVFSILLAVQGMKLLLRTTAVIDLDLMQMATAHSKSTDGTAAFS